MSGVTSADVKGLIEAYTAVYDEELRFELEEEQREVEELSLEIIENAAYVLFSQGYNVEDVISYFSEAAEDTIVEDYINFAEGNIIVESVAVSDEYIVDQFEILNEGIMDAVRGAAGFVGKGLQKAGQFFTNKSIPKAGKQLSLPLGQAAKPGLLQRAATGAKDLIKKIPGAQKAVDIGRTVAKTPLGRLGSKVLPGAGLALGAMDAVNRAKRGDWGGAALSGLGAAASTALPPGLGTAAALGIAGLQAGTDAAGLTGDKSKKGPSAKTTPAAPKPPKGAGYVDVAGKGKRYFASSDQKYYKNYNDALAARNSRTGKKPAAAAPAAPAKPAPAAPTPAPRSATPALKPATPNASTGLTQGPKQTPDQIKAAQASVDADVKAANTPDALNRPAPAGSALEAEQRRRQKKPGTTAFKPPGTPDTDTEKTQGQDTLNQSYEYDAYDLVSEYLFSQGHVNTLAEAHYVMLGMDADTIGTIVEYLK